MKLLIKGLEKIRPPRDIHEWEPGEPHEGKEPMTVKALPKEVKPGGHLKPPSVEKGQLLEKDYGYGGSKEVESLISKPLMGVKNVGGDRPGSRRANMKRVEEIKNIGSKLMTVKKSVTKAATATLLLDSMLVKACSQKGVRLTPDFKMTKAEEGIYKDFEHMAGEYKKLAPTPPSTVRQQSRAFGWKKPAMFEGPKNKREAVAEAAKPVQGASGAVKDAPEGVFTSAPAHPEAAPKTPPLHPGQTISMQSAVKKPPQTPSMKSMSKGSDFYNYHKKSAEIHRNYGGSGLLHEAAARAHDAAAEKHESEGGMSMLSKKATDKANKFSQRAWGESGHHRMPEMPEISMSKSREAIEILKGMLSKASTNEQYPGNPANERGPVHGTPHGGEGPAQVSVSGHACPANHSQENKNVRGAAFAGREGNQNGSVHGTPHGGEGPAQTAVSGFDGPGNDDQMNKSGYDPDKHYMIWSAHPHVKGRWMAERSRGGAYFNPDHEGHALTKHPKYKVLPLGQDPNPSRAKQSFEPIHSAHDKEVSKAVSSMSVPRMPRAMAMAMDTWRSATNVLTRGNSRFAQHAGTNPLIGEIVDQLDEDSYKRATRLGPVLKACNSCGRTYTLNKSDDSCPSCSSLPLSVMAKSRGGYLVSSFIDD